MSVFRWLKDLRLKLLLHGSFHLPFSYPSNLLLFPETNVRLQSNGVESSVCYPLPLVPGRKEQLCTEFEPMANLLRMKLSTNFPTRG